MQLINNQLGIGGQNVLPKVLDYVEFSICGSIRAMVGRAPLIRCGSLGFHFNSLLLQKLEVGTIPGFGNLASCNLQRFVGFFCMRVGESIMDTSVHFSFTTTPFVFIWLRTLDSFWVFG